MIETAVPHSYVECVNSTGEEKHLTLGIVYQVHYTRFDRGRALYKLVGIEGFWQANRFRKIEPDEILPKAVR